MRRFVNVIKSVIILVYSFVLSLFVRRDDKCFAFGSWGGKLYIDNSRYLFEYMLHNLDDSYSFVWVGNPELKNEMPADKRVRVLKKDSFQAIHALQRCKYMFCSQIAYVDICSYNIYRNAKLVYLHHGFPIKRVEADSLDYNHGGLRLSQKIYRAFVSYGHEYNLFTVSAPIQKKHYLSAYKYMGCREDNTFCFGTPRNDFLYNITKDEQWNLKKKYAALLGFDFEKKLVLYLPTFRRTGVETQSLYLRAQKDKDKMNGILHEHNAVLIEKGHFAEYSMLASIDKEINNENYIHVTKNINVQELLAITDVLISDYSGAFVDFLLVDRPIIHYVYDYEFYKNEDSGLYFTLDEFSCGPAPDSFEGLCTELNVILNGIDNYKGIREQRRKLFLCCEKGTAGRSITEYIKAL